MMKGRGLGGVGDEGAAAARVAQVLISAMRIGKITPFSITCFFTAE